MRDSTKNPEIGNAFVRVLCNIWRLGRVGVTKFGMNVSNKKLLNGVKCQIAYKKCIMAVFTMLYLEILQLGDPLLVS